MRDKYADVVVDITAGALDRIFQYLIPEDMEVMPAPGMVAEVPFGKGNRLITGYVVGTGNQTEYDPEKLKPLSRIIARPDDARAQLVAMAAWMRRRYGCSMIQALRTVLPVRAKITPREMLTLELACPLLRAQEELRVMRRKNQKARARLLEALIAQRVLPWDLVREKLNITAPVRRSLEQLGLIQVKKERSGPQAPERMKQVQPPPVLNEEQRRAADRVLGDMRAGRPGGYLLCGVTGSGKTFVYMELIEEVLKRGQQAIVLIPEIALTYQTLLRFYQRFGSRVSVVNSRMSKGERYEQFLRVQKGEVDVMIGPRSALFTPFSSLGIIVIDEEQEPAYISESMPRYNAREAASFRAKQAGAALVLGSATPSVEAYHAALSGELTLLRLTQRALGSPLAKVQVTDLREELKGGNRSIFGKDLRKKLAQTLEEGGQAMLFLNRRGYAGFVSCRSCGHVIKCPHCDVSLSYHSGGRLVCHYCGYEQEHTGVCPACGSDAIRMFRAGTQQIEQETARLFPQARVLRMDADTTRKKDSYTAILSAFADHEADILIGTQMIVKGHDFPDVSLVGVLAADISLYAPDYRSAERTFQLLTQAAGRAGRARRPGRVVIQTYDPEHYAIVYAARQDYEGFYEKEMEFRLLTGYPPAGALTGIYISGTDLALLERACAYLQSYAKRIAAGRRVSVLGPSDEQVAKVQDIYRKVMYLKSPDFSAVETVRMQIQEYIRINPGFAPLSIQYKVE